MSLSVSLLPHAARPLTLTTSQSVTRASLSTSTSPSSLPSLLRFPSTNPFNSRPQAFGSPFGRATNAVCSRRQVHALQSQFTRCGPSSSSYSSCSSISFPISLTLPLCLSGSLPLTISILIPSLHLIVPTSASAPRTHSAIVRARLRDDDSHHHHLQPLGATASAIRACTQPIIIFLLGRASTSFVAQASTTSSNTA